MIKLIEDKQDGLVSLMGKRVLLMCAGYFYEGKLVGMNDQCVKLEDPGIVYSTGTWTDKNYADRQALHSDVWFVSLGLIESFGPSKNV